MPQHLMALAKFGFACVAILAASLGARAATPFPVQDAIRLVDDTGTQIRLSKPASRVISLAPHMTELVFAVGAGNTLVGVVSHSDYPKAAKALPVVGSSNQINFEAVVASKPDLVLAWASGNGVQLIKHLKALGFVVYVGEPRTLEDIAHSLHQVGLLTGHEKEAGVVVETFERKHHALKMQNRDKQPVNVFYQIWDDPLLTINDDHLISDVIRLCGGRNVFADAIPLVPKISREVVIRRNPDAIVASADSSGRSGWLDAWRMWPMLAAVKRGHLYAIHPDLMSRHTPRILQGAQQLCRYLETVRTADAKNGKIATD